MISCLIGFLVAVLVAIIGLWIVETACAALKVPIPPNMMMIIRLIVVLALLLRVLPCFGALGHFWGAV